MDQYPIDGLPTPDPSHSPETIVAMQLDGLATNDDPFEDAGIGVAYNFASPANRRATGPFDRFVQMVRGRRYAPMVDHTAATVKPIDRDGGRAEQRVELTGPNGRTETYAFGLSKHRDGELDGCWLTDRVTLE
ncbi:MAG: DUF4864 domain-containing protein [Halobellus sp.]|uniref:DUF4864 domain-containing protein n=1 Tax=Halobellus sp. TaxID=1979212 RepID=UPI0035D40911